MSRRCASLLSAMILLLFAHVARASVERFAVLIGSNRGDAGELDLRYAESDAEGMYGVLKDVGGFRPENMLLLRSEPARVIERSLIAVNDRVRAAQSRAGTEVVLFVYYSGHADAQALHSAQTHLELGLLEQLVRSSAAAFRVLLIDACRSGSLTRVKGGKRGPGFDVRVDEGLNGEGTVFLSSSSANEDSQESDALRGSFFTHFFRSGLLGPADTDNDGRIALDEAYRYAHDATLRASSRTFAGTQHATFRFELKGQGRVVLTAPLQYAETRAWLEFPEGREYLVLSNDQNGAVTGEVGARDRVRRLSVRPGRYFIRGRTPAQLLEGSVSVAAGAKFRVNDTLLDRVEYARLARKGDGDVHFVHGPSAGVVLRSSLANSGEPCGGFFAGYSLVFREVTVAPRLRWCLSSFENSNLEATVNEFDTSIALQRAFDSRRWSFNVGVAAGVSIEDQTFRAAGRAPSRVSLAPHLGVEAGLTFDLGQGLGVFTQILGEAYVFQLEAATTRETRTTTSLALGSLIGVSRYF